MAKGRENKRNEERGFGDGRGQNGIRITRMKNNNNELAKTRHYYLTECHVDTKYNLHNNSFERITPDFKSPNQALVEGRISH